MPDVSRVEYDAALKRVVKASLGCSMSSADSCPFRSFRCQCRTSTLAALGLDEPPTEDKTPDDNLAHWLLHTVGTASSVRSAKRCVERLVAEELARARVVPPSEPPKACPTCKGRGELKQPAGYPINCDECDGTERTP